MPSSNSSATVPSNRASLPIRPLLGLGALWLFTGVVLLWWASVQTYEFAYFAYAPFSEEELFFPARINGWEIGGILALILGLASVCLALGMLWAVRATKRLPRG